VPGSKKIYQSLYLQVLVFALLFGFALHACGERNNIVHEFIERFSQVLFGIIGIVMRVAPIGAFGAMAFAVGRLRASR
jgi:aerobic C4-dicarboxylate transport protein